MARGLLLKSFLTRQTWVWMLSQHRHHKESKMAILSHDILHSRLQRQMFKHLMLPLTQKENKKIALKDLLPAWSLQFSPHK